MDQERARSPTPGLEEEDDDASLIASCSSSSSSTSSTSTTSSSSTSMMMMTNDDDDDEMASLPTSPRVAQVAPPPAVPAVAANVQQVQAQVLNFARTASQADVCELIRKLSVATSVIAELETANRALVAANRQLMASALSSAVRASTLITSRKRRRQPDTDAQDDCDNGHPLDAKKHKPLS